MVGTDVTARTWLSPFAPVRLTTGSLNRPISSWSGRPRVRTPGRDKGAQRRRPSGGPSPRADALSTPARNICSPCTWPPQRTAPPHRCVRPRSAHGPPPGLCRSVWHGPKLDCQQTFQSHHSSRHGVSHRSARSMTFCSLSGFSTRYPKPAGTPQSMDLSIARSALLPR